MPVRFCRVLSVQRAVASLSPAQADFWLLCEAAIDSEFFLDKIALTID